MLSGFPRISPPRALGLLAWAVFATTAALATADPLVAIRRLPANNPYRAPLEKLLSLPEADRDLLQTWAQKPEDGQAPPSLTEEQRAWVADLGANLLAAAHQPQAAEWPLVPDPADPDNPMAIGVPHIGAVLQLAKIVNHSAESLPPGAAIEYYAAVAQLGRQMRAGGTLIEQLVGVAAEGLATADVSRRLGGFSKADLDQLTAAWSGLRPAPGLDQVLRRERDLFFLPLVEKVIRPGLAALIAEENELAGVSAPRAADDGVSAFRLTAIINDGQRMIGLENRSAGTSFFVQEGKTVNDVTVLSIDFDRKRAMLRVCGKDAVLDLVSRRIVERTQAASRLLRLLKTAQGVSSNESSQAEQVIADLVKRARAHPEGVDGCLRDLLADHDAGLAAVLLRAEHPAFEARPARTADESPLLMLTFPALDTVARRLTQAELTTTMLGAAADVRRRQLDGERSPVPAADPWAKKGEGLTLVPANDGGFTLRSIYENHSGKPTEYKYAAPDAGLVRR